MKQPIPDSALDDRLGWVGTAGSGKSYNAMGRVERLLAKKARVCCVDPLGVFWGLRLQEDGRTESGFNIPIFGGPHGDLPLTEHSGALIGETVAGMAESCIIDLSEIGTKAGERRFMLHFLTALYRKSKDEPLHLVIDEADMFCPQKLMDKDGEAAKLLGMMETVVRRGRIKGFIPWLITQRPAVISKDVLSQVDGLVAFKLTSSQDRDALSAWVEGSAEKEDWKTMRAALPAMERGQGVVWIPGRGVMETVSFPEKATFDSSRTPKRGEKKSTAALKPLDLGTLKERLAKVDAERKADDPKALKAEITRLNAELKKAPQPIQQPIDPTAVTSAEQRGFKRGFDEAVNQGAICFDTLRETVRRTVRNFAINFDESLKSEEIKFVVCQDDIPSGSPAVRPADTSPGEPRGSILRAPSPAASGDGGSLTPSLQRVVNAIGWWRKIGFDPVERARASVVAGFSPKASTFGVYVADLVKMGLVSSPGAGKVALTEAGWNAAVVPKAGTAEELRQVARGLLGTQEAKVFDVIYRAYPHEVARKDVAEEVGLSPTASTTGVYIAAVAAFGIVEVSSPGHVRAAEWLFP
jgi:hypothetical protein